MPVLVKNTCTIATAKSNLAEVYGNRTHLSGYQPKTLDLKSRLPTSDRDTSKTLHSLTLKERRQYISTPNLKVNAIPAI